MLTSIFDFVAVILGFSGYLLIGLIVGVAYPQRESSARVFSALGSTFEI